MIFFGIALYETRMFIDKPTFVIPKNSPNHMLLQTHSWSVHSVRKTY